MSAGRAAQLSVAAGAAAAAVVSSSSIRPAGPSRADAIAVAPPMSYIWVGRGLQDTAPSDDQLARAAGWLSRQASENDLIAAALNSLHSEALSREELLALGYRAALRMTDEQRLLTLQDVMQTYQRPQAALYDCSEESMIRDDDLDSTDFSTTESDCDYQVDQVHEEGESDQTQEEAETMQETHNTSSWLDWFVALIKRVLGAGVQEQQQHQRLTQNEDTDKRDHESEAAEWLANIGVAASFIVVLAFILA